MRPIHYLRCFCGIAMREWLRFLNQRGRFFWYISDLLRAAPLLGLLDLGVLVKFVQKLARHRRRGHRVSHHGAQAGIFAQTHEIIEALAAHRV